MMWKIRIMLIIFLWFMCISTIIQDIILALQNNFLVPKIIYERPLIPWKNVFTGIENYFPFYFFFLPHQQIEMIPLWKDLLQLAFFALICAYITFYWYVKKFGKSYDDDL